MLDVDPDISSDKRRNEDEKKEGDAHLEASLAQKSKMEMKGIPIRNFAAFYLSGPVAVKASLTGLMAWLGVISVSFSDWLKPGEAFSSFSLPSIKGGNLIQGARGDGTIALAASTMSFYEFGAWGGSAPE